MKTNEQKRLIKEWWIKATFLIKNRKAKKLRFGTKKNPTKFFYNTAKVLDNANKWMLNPANQVLQQQFEDGTVDPFKYICEKVAESFPKVKVGDFVEFKMSEGKYKNEN